MTPDLADARTHLAAAVAALDAAAAAAGPGPMRTTLHSMAADARTIARRVGYVADARPETAA